MGTCLSRCYPETNASTNGFTNGIKGHDRGSLKCEYRRIFRGNRSSGEESKRWSSTPKRQKYSEAESSLQMRHSIHTDRCLPSIPVEALTNTDSVTNFTSYHDNELSPQESRMHYVHHHSNSTETNNCSRSRTSDLKGVEKLTDASGRSRKSCLNSPKTSNNGDPSPKIEALFEIYSDPEQNCILADGIERFCNDLLLQPDDFRVLLLAWHFQAETMCRFTRKEFCVGFKKLKVDSIQSLCSKIFAGCACEKCGFARLSAMQEKSQIDSGDDGVAHLLQKANDGDQFYGCIYPSHEDGSFVTEVTSNREAFRSLYKWSYRFALDLETGQRTLPLDMAVSMWQLVFSKKLAFFEMSEPQSGGMASTEDDPVKPPACGGSQKALLTAICSPDTSEQPASFQVIIDKSELMGTIVINSKPSQQLFDRGNTGDGCNLRPKSLVDQVNDDSVLASLHHALPLVRSWFIFMYSLKGSLRGITRDTWDMFFTFIESVGEDGSGYNDAEAWPSLFDDFIEWLTGRNTSN